MFKNKVPGNGEVKCDFCQTSYPNRRSLTIHEFIHLNEDLDSYLSCHGWLKESNCLPKAQRLLPSSIPALCSIKNNNVPNKKQSHRNIMSEVVSRNYPLKMSCSMSKEKNGIVENSKVKNGIVENSKVKNGIVENLKVKNGITVNPKEKNSIVENLKEKNGIIVNSKEKNCIINNSREKNGIVENSKEKNCIINNSKVKNYTVEKSKWISLLASSVNTVNRDVLQFQNGDAHPFKGVSFQEKSGSDNPQAITTIQSFNDSRTKADAMSKGIDFRRKRTISSDSAYSSSLSDEQSSVSPRSDIDSGSNSPDSAPELDSKSEDNCRNETFTSKQTPRSWSATPGVTNFNENAWNPAHRNAGPKGLNEMKHAWWNKNQENKQTEMCHKSKMFKVDEGSCYYIY